jgi:hypothetical protein
MILVIIENILHKKNIYIYYLQYQIVLEQWRAKVECIHAARLVSIETDVTICQEDAQTRSCSRATESLVAILYPSVDPQI